MLGGRTRVNTPDPNSLSNTDPCQRSTGRARGISHTVSLSSTQTTLNLGDEVEPASPTRIPGRHSIRNASTSSISKAANVTRTRAKSTASNSSIALGKPDKISQPSAGSTGAACARATSKRSSRSSIASIATASTITSTATATAKSRVNKSTTSITGVPKSTNSTTANSGTRKATSTTAASRSTTKLTTQSKTNLAGDKPTSKSSSIASAKTINLRNRLLATIAIMPTRQLMVVIQGSKPRARPATSANSTTSTPRVTANKGNTVKSNSSGKNANKSTTSVASVKSVSAKTAVSAPMHARSSSGQSARSVKSITRPIRPTSTITPTPPTRITTTNATTNTTALKAPKSTRTKPSKGGNGSNTITNLQSSSSSSLSQIPRLSSKSTPSAKASNNSGRIRSATTTNSHGASNNTRQKSKIESTRKSINSSNNNNTDTNATLITPPHSASGSSKSPVLPPSNIPVLSKSIGTQRASPHRRQGSYPIDPNDTTLTSALAIARRNAAGGGGSGANAHPTRTSSPISARGNLTRKPPNLKIDTNSRLSVNSQSMSRQGSDDKRHNGSSRGVARPRPLRTLSGHPTLSPDGGERQPRSSFRFKTPPATPTSARSFPAADPFSDAESAPGEFGRAIRNWTTGNPDDSHAETSQSNRYREPPEYERVARVFGWRGGVLAATAADSEDTDDKEVDIDVWSGIDTASMGGQQQSRRRRHRSQQQRDDAEPTDGDASDSGMAKSILRRLRRRATSRLSEFEADQRMQRARSPSNVETDDDLLANASFRSDDAHDAIVSDQEPGSARDERRPVSPSSRHSENRWRWPRSLTKSQNFDQREAGPASPGPSSFPSLPDLHRAKSTRQLPDTSSARLGPNMEQRSSSVGHQRRKLSVSVVQYDPTPIAHDLIPPVPAIPPEYLPGGGVTAATRSSIAQQRLDRKKTHRRTTSQASRASKYSAPSVDLDRDDDLLLLDPTIFDRIYEDDLQSVWADITLSETNTATNSQLSGSVKSPHSRVASESFSTVSSRSSLGHRRASLNDVAEQVATRPSLTSDRVSFTSMDPAPIASSSKRLLVASTPEKMVYI
ncbi:hypothetical protein BDF22DRAFT_739433 [Syncephalis plumigaleata]|nr:hypothetical protein BDF22DRAFT_739433 [Syncephalis plumigaleata]